MGEVMNAGAALERVGGWVRERSSARNFAKRYAVDDYWSRLKNHLSDFGISRVADITGLDVVGLPVAQAVRPLALSNSVNQGKGLSLAAAAVGAVMEAVETFAGEDTDQSTLVAGTARAMVGDTAARMFERHLLEDVLDPQWADAAMTWVDGIDLENTRQALVPAALVHTDFVPSSPHCQTPFLRTTTGLGAGSCISQAIRHGMLEAVERLSSAQAMTMHGFFDQCRIDPETFADRETLDLLRHLETLGILSGHYICPSPTGVYTVWTRLIDDKDTPVGLPLPAEGYACRTTMNAALSASLHEAIQTRCSVIAGGRDDLTRQVYPRYPDEAVLRFERARLRSPVASRNHHPQGEQLRCDQEDAWFTVLLAAFAQWGLKPICVPLMVRDDIPLIVTRIVVIGAADIGEPIR